MIITATELRVLLGLSGTITDAERALMELVIPEAQATVANILRYDPEYSARRLELLPQIGDVPGMSESDEWRANSTHAYQIARSEGDETIQLKFLPVRSITEIREDTQAHHGTYAGAFGDGTLLVEGVDFAPEYDAYDADTHKICTSGLIRRIGTCWPSTPGTVRADYVSGYTAAELNGVSGSQINARAIKDAILQLAMSKFRRYTLLQKPTVGGFTAGVKTSETMGDYSYTVATTPETSQVSAADVTGDIMAKLQPFINYGDCFA